MFTIPQSFTLNRYRFTLKAETPLHLPGFKASTLRGGFGYAFKRMVCFQMRPCRQACELGNDCPYGYIFETSPPETSKVLKNIANVPRPFIIEPLDNQRRDIPTGETLSFDLILVGRAANYLPYFITVFRELGRIGLGRGRGRFELLGVQALSQQGSNPVEVYDAQDQKIRSLSASITAESIIARATTLPTDQLTLRFLTPTRIKHRGNWVNEGPPFHVLVKALLSRISALSYFHCGHEIVADFRGIIDQATAIQTISGQTGWKNWVRYSGRQRERIEMGGLVGLVTYQGDLTPYLPLLTLGEWVHVGKSAVFGNGQYVCQDQAS